VSDPVHLALLGAGRMGRMHLEALRESNAVRICAIADPSADALAAAAAIDERPAGYAATEEALARAEVQGVLIAASTPLHGTLVEVCAQHHLPILCEKPCGFTLEDIDAAADAARDHGVTLQVGYWRRYVPELIALREQLLDGHYGELLQIGCSQWDAEPPSPAFRASSGGIAVDMGVHELDQLRWLTGSDVERLGDIVTAGAVGDDVDCAVIALELTGGGVGIVSLGRHFPHGDCVWVELIGTRGHARVDVLWGDSGKTWHPALRAQAEDFARCIRDGGASAGASADDARRTLELAALVQERCR
jgi:myo-inositol 2-dehydrogenase / D-chiro-inositol 1-dehydrogenase